MQVCFGILDNLRKSGYIGADRNDVITVRCEGQSTTRAWQTPILRSSHSANVVYYGANRLFRSLDRGENLKPISPVLTDPDVLGIVLCLIMITKFRKKKAGVTIST